MHCDSTSDRATITVLKDEIRVELSFISFCNIVQMVKNVVGNYTNLNSNMETSVW